MGLSRTALLLQPTGIAVQLAGAIEAHTGLGDACSWCLVVPVELAKRLAAWTGQRVGGGVEGKGRAREGPVFTLAFLPQWNVRLDALLLN
jgi:hypothetical protein